MEFREREAAAEYKERAYPLKRIPPGAMARAMAQIQKAKPQGLPAGIFSDYAWFGIGPAPITNFPVVHRIVSGRVTAVAFDPSNPSYHWLIGSAQGGIWETTDQGGHWTARTDDQASLAIGAIAFALSNPSVVYAGTGEPNFSGDSYAGAGLLVSRNGGMNWQMLNDSFAETSFSSIKVDSTNKNRIVVATIRGTAGLEESATNIPPTAPPRGVFVSNNGGTNFTRVLTGEATDLIMNPYDFNRQYAALGEVYGSSANGVYRTTTDWTNSSIINGPWTGLVAPTNIGRIALAISPSNTGTVYVGVTYNKIIGGLVGIWRTDDAWDPSPVWVQLPNPDTGPYLWYSFALSVDPNDYTTLYLAELKLWRYSSGAWNNIGESTHDDNHVMAWVPEGFFIYKMLLGNDGGIWSSDDPASGNWSDLLNGGGLSISQMYKGSVHPYPGNALALAGTQDNGTANNLGDLTWNSFLGGDGGDNAISRTNPDADWAVSEETNPKGVIHIYRTQDRGWTLKWLVSGIDNNNVPFFVHFEKSPYNDDLFIAGTVQLWRCTNFFSVATPMWYSNSPVILDTNGLPVAISAMAFAPSDTNGLIYAFGTEDGQLRITTDGGMSWNDLDALNAVPGRYVTGLAFSPVNPDVLYVTLSGFDEGTPGQPGHLFETMDARAATPSWINISPPVDLPNDCIAVDPNNANTIFVGADIGVWATTNGAATWTHLGPETGMPNVAVYDLRMNTISRVTAFTHGRGAFTYAQRIPILMVDGPIKPVDIACDGCPGVSWVNPGDLVTIDLPLQNILPIDTVDLTVTMLPSADVSPVTGTQNYGIVPGQSAPVSRRFSFIAGGSVGGAGPSPNGITCGSTVQVTFDLQDQGADLGQLVVPFRLGVPSHPLSEEFDESPVPTLPPGWSSSGSGVGAPWMDTSNAPPNVAAGGDPDQSRVGDQPIPGQTMNVCAFTPAMAGNGQSLLTTAPFSIATSQAQFVFREAFVVSNAYDGCILEMAIGSQPFQDILRAGGSFAQNGYNVALKESNPLGPVPGWSGDSGGWLPVVVNLPASAAGQTVQLRWHFATSRGLTNGGWYVDSVAVTEPLCLPPVSNPVIVNPTVNSNLFTFAIDTVAGRTYVLEYKTNLTDTAWQFLQDLTGDGSQQIITVPIDSASQRFYHFHLQ